MSVKRSPRMRAARWRGVRRKAPSTAPGRPAGGTAFRSGGRSTEAARVRRHAGAGGGRRPVQGTIGRATRRGSGGQDVYSREVAGVLDNKTRQTDQGQHQVII